VDLPDVDEDLDLALRHVTRLFPLGLARALLPPGTAVTSADWTETQITSRQRRLDRVMVVEADGVRRFEHVEVQTRMRRNVPFRVFEYQTLLALALATQTPRGAPVPPVHSTVVLLSGRKKPWPARVEYRLSPPGVPFSGVSFALDAVYQRTVAELSARGSPLWMIFAPLALDADPVRMQQVVERLRAETPAQEFAELAATLTVVATKEGRRRGLREVILGLLRKEDVMRSGVFELGKQDGRLEGEQQAVTRMFEKRLGRPLAEAERAVLRRRLGSLGADRVMDVRDELGPDALAAWLAAPDAA
jgi:hypothetical protein